MHRSGSSPICSGKALPEHFSASVAGLHMAGDDLLVRAIRVSPASPQDVPEEYDGAGKALRIGAAAHALWY